MKITSRENGFNISSGLMALEPRIMYDAAGVLTGAEVQADDGQPVDSPESRPEAQEEANGLRDLFSDYVPPVQAEIRELVLVAGNIENYQDLLKDVSPEARVVVIDPDRDGLEQINTVLSQYEGLEAIHIVSHGGPAYLKLGQQQLSLDNLEAHAATVSEWGRALSSDGDILLYGCEVAEGEAGREFVHQLSELTGADVAASSDITGHEDFGGDWDLEHQEGTVEAGLWGEVSQFHGTLVPPTVTAGGVLSYTEGDGEVVIDSGITVTDSDSPNLVNAEVKILSNYASHQDELVFTDTSNISGSWNPATGTLTLSGVDTVANYELALQSVRYVNHSDEPIVTSRVVSFTVNDGGVDSSVVTASINLTAVNDAPEIAAPGTLSLQADTPYSMFDLYQLIRGTIDDDDHHDTLGIAITGADNTNGTWQYSTDGGASWTAFGSLSDSNATLLQGFKELSGKVQNTTDLAAGDLMINGTGVGPVILTSPSTYGINMQGAFNLANAVNAVSGTTGVVAELDTLYAGIAATGSSTTPDTIEFDLNGSHVTVNIPADTPIYQVASAVAQAINNLSSGHDLHAWVGDGANGGMANSVVIEGYGDIVISNLVDGTTASSGLANGNYSRDAGHNGGEIILIPTGGSYSVTSGAGNDSILNLVGLGGGTATTYISGDTSGDGYVNVNFPLNKIRFVPNAGFSGTSTLNFRAWDQTDGLANGLTGVDVSANGGSTPYSSGTFTITVSFSTANTVEPLPLIQLPPPPSSFEPLVKPESLLPPALEPTAEPGPEPEPAGFEPPPPVEDDGGESVQEVTAEAEMEPEPEQPAEAEGEEPTEEEATAEEESTEEEGDEVADEEPLEEVAEEIALAPEEGEAASAVEAAPPDAPQEAQGEQGLNEQLAKEAKKAAAERSEIIQLFEEVYELLQCK